MRYLIELDSPDFHILIEAAKREIIASAAVHNEWARRMGRGHAMTIAAGQREVAAARGLAALIKANEEATPDRATGSTDARSLPTGEEMPVVYGAPRRKPSNARRSSSNG